MSRKVTKESPVTSINEVPENFRSLFKNTSADNDTILMMWNKRDAEITTTTFDDPKLRSRAEFANQEFEKRGLFLLLNALTWTVPDRDQRRKSGDGENAIENFTIEASLPGVNESSIEETEMARPAEKYEDVPANFRVLFERFTASPQTVLKLWNSRPPRVDEKYYDDPLNIAGAIERNEEYERAGYFDLLNGGFGKRDQLAS